MSTANKSVEVPSIANPITKSPGFAKKLLSSCKLDLMALCAFGCRYCSSNIGNYLRINRERFADLAWQQLGMRLYPATSPELTMIWPDVLEKIAAQIDRHGKQWGAGETLVFSMLTDAFSGPTLNDGTTEKALRMVLEGTSFRVRVLTKNSTVGTPKWIKFFQQYPGRIVVGLSTGTLDAAWAKRIEVGTPPPQARIAATQALQAAGIPTFGMLCPIFPDVLQGDQLEKLVDAINPSACEHVWAEPYNDRANWRLVRDGYEPGSPGWLAMTGMFEDGREGWSRYATDLFLRLQRKAQREGWIEKLRFLQYEANITEADAERVHDFDGLLLQSKPEKKTGYSQHPVFGRMQRESGEPPQALTGPSSDEMEETDGLVTLGIRRIGFSERPSQDAPLPGPDDSIGDPAARRSDAAIKAWDTRRQREASDPRQAFQARVTASAAAEKAWATMRGVVLTTQDTAAIWERAKLRAATRV